jgi:hypothetical protein
VSRNTELTIIPLHVPLSEDNSLAFCAMDLGESEEVHTDADSTYMSDYDSGLESVNSQNYRFTEMGNRRSFA